MGLARIHEAKATDVSGTVEQYPILSRSGHDTLQGMCFYLTALYFDTRKSELWLICHFDTPFLFFFR